MTPNYESWSKEELIARLKQLELETKTTTTTTTKHSKPPRSSTSRPFHFSSHPKRKIAIKFCYSGWEYNGLAYQNGPTPLPTVEDVLFKAFVKARLVDEKGGLDGCGWEKCGRTDRGVSAAGQVVSLWVRSALPTESPCSILQPNSSSSSSGSAQSQAAPSSSSAPEGEEIETLDDLVTYAVEDIPQNTSAPSQSSLKRELRYVSILNRLLPPTIRVLAWSPISPDFSARFNCKHRHYKYFFTSHGLDLSLMQSAATRLVGEHDFRNLCKLDPGKQITNFRRCVMHAQISPVDSDGDGENQVYVFDLMGSAFLYHQVRHIMAVLFLVGTGLEHPSIVSALLNVSPQDPPLPPSPSRTLPDSQSPLPLVDRKPEYQMADALPLMLWDCAYAPSDVSWQTDVNDSDSNGTETESGTGSDLYHQLHSIHQRSLIHTSLDAHFLLAAAQHHAPPPQYFPFSRTSLTPRPNAVLGVPLGAGTYKRGAKYVPLLERKRLDHVEVANERWRVGRGSKYRKQEKIDETVLDASSHHLKQPLSDEWCEIIKSRYTFDLGGWAIVEVNIGILRRWPNHLDDAVAALNYRILPALKFSPKELLVGQIINTPRTNITNSTSVQQLDGHNGTVQHAMKRKAAFDKRVLARSPREVVFFPRQLTLAGEPMSGEFHARRLQAFVPHEGTKLAEEQEKRESERGKVVVDEEVIRKLEEERREWRHGRAQGIWWRR
ncbi:tRNA pseudouridine synthase [Rhizopogon vinicolor AM-OR11-026]|uniref:tRNA pseudouridine synthase n=1 Tax=Rhizopogon vinicolor AM-OR11-026 TaxID=1314800 RepID=A0A1B7N0T8_9AGAM|nr:tRNA pseudouridine synthase [Rhizopogon vinicolor AM-OR11-026]